ncbi:MAG: prepilin-type N-terminal cleavage/methylation domain-containing protein [Oscillospiraceae bacterium]|jgi:prepilin-type N-terminal cleavage/methylation domain-containing protein|nr:prepilin-type N-terminal cleavage/methylation domain-containing protein [Oscillospiraceae bacterium]
MSKNNKGFSLLELIIAIAIVGLVIGPLLHMFVTSAQFSLKGKQMDTETNTLANDMEEVKSDDDAYGAEGTYTPTAGTTITLDATGSYTVGTTGVTVDLDDINSQPIVAQPEHSANICWVNVSEVEESNGYSLTHTPEVFVKEVTTGVNAGELDEITVYYDDLLRTVDITIDVNTSDTNYYLISAKYTYLYKYDYYDSDLGETYSATDFEDIEVSLEYGPLQLEKDKTVSGNKIYGIDTLYFAYFPFLVYNSATNKYDVEDYVTTLNVDCTYAPTFPDPDVTGASPPARDLNLFLVEQNTSDIIKTPDNETGVSSNPTAQGLLGLYKPGSNRLFLITLDNGTTQWQSTKIVFPN